ncbi:hypothetical protein J4450_03255 [Candidatus Micrarchaeota archaeon]|nr:hypothetical protein [Candidatus Micrarchaeota archaeon]
MALAYKKEEDLLAGKVYAKVDNLIGQAHERVAGLLVGFDRAVPANSEFNRIFGK